MKIIEGNITSPKGFSATGIHAGIKKQKPDLMLLKSDVLATAAACFTKNIVKAAPVILDSQIISAGGKVKGIVVNSGNANACTSEQGMTDAKAMVSKYAELMGAKPDEALVCSTGVIGVNLPMDKILQGIETAYPLMGYTSEHGNAAASAIMTTDTFQKTMAIELELSGKKVTIGGMAKGSGMIHPNMATLLSFITTDADISATLLSKALQESVTETYNMISVDGDTSTNDTVIVLANGLAGNQQIDNEDTEDYKIFAEALNHMNRKLAIDIAKDGEGATKLLEVNVSGAANETDAKLLARSVASSNLFKAAMFGADATWGRVMCAMGYSGATFNPEVASINFSSCVGDIKLIDEGTPLVFDEDSAKSILSESVITINISLKEGSGKATAWGCDLTYDYVKINGAYRT